MHLSVSSDHRCVLLVRPPFTNYRHVLCHSCDSVFCFFKIIVCNHWVLHWCAQGSVQSKHHSFSCVCVLSYRRIVSIIACSLKVVCICLFCIFSCTVFCSTLVRVFSYACSALLQCSSLVHSFRRITFECCFKFSFLINSGPMTVSIFFTRCALSEKKTQPSSAFQCGAPYRSDNMIPLCETHCTSLHHLHNFASLTALHFLGHSAK